MGQNVRKISRNEGLEYITRKGTLVQARNTIYHRCGRCVNKCNDIPSDDDRDKICQNYGKMGDMQRQWDYIANHVVIIIPLFVHVVNILNGTFKKTSIYSNSIIYIYTI